MSGLADRECVPCKGGIAPLTPEEIEPLLAQLGGWEVADGHHLRKALKFPDFVTALAFVNRVGELAEEVNHHPDLTLGWGRVGIEIWTHKIDGLAEADFVFAARVDRLS